MPIIILWAEAMAPHASDVLRWLKNMDRSTFLLDRWLEKRVPAAQRMEEATAAFPIFNYYNTALTARVADMQFGSLLTVPVDSIGTHVERALDEWNLPRDISQQARSAGLPGEVFRVVEGMVDGVLGSLDRFMTPNAQMFEPKGHTASDIIGMAALVWRTIGANRTGIYSAAARLAQGLGAPANDNGGTMRSAGDGKPAGEPGLPLAFQIDELSRYVVAGLLVIPAVSRLLGIIGKDALTLAKYKALAKFEEWETKAWAYRKALLGSFLNGMSAITETSLQLLLQIGGGITGIIDAFVAIGVEYLRGLTAGVVSLADQIRSFWSGVIALINQVAGFVASIAAVDIGEVIHNALVTIQEVIAWFADEFYDKDHRPAAYTAPAQFAVTIGELVLNEGPGAEANNQINIAAARLGFAVHHAMGTWAILYKGALFKAKDIHIDNVVTGLEMLAKALALPRDPGRAQPVLKVDLSTAPDLVAAVVRPLRIGLIDAVGKVGTAADGAVGDVFGSAQKRLNETADAFHKEAQDSAAFGPKGLVMRMVGDTDALLKSLFGTQSPEARKTGLEAVALAFSAWMQGGFDTIANMASGYIRFMLDEWTEQIAKNEDLPLQVMPTSPKKLLQRAELGRVHLPRLRIVASGNPIDRELAERVAAAFRDEVEAAYRTGAERLSRLAAAA
ncbi:MAG: hypothetical protein V4564_05860 [Pseudomonadota bacterium]